MTFLKITFGFLFLIAASCNTTKNTTEEVSSKNTEEIKMSEKLIAEGFQEAIVIASEVENDCPYTLMVNNNKDMLYDPINLEEEYKSNGEKVWVKYRPLRRQNRCTKASPVEITSIQKREE
ncbi:hypothetical protein [Patiriisocius hiemis]|uniref:Lipoprotein n=1 Tax=Patiriisocius hiemis TaxID=3075604 RepID=A0ABU2YE54_9FLAO|nr:hypothetical protein [Constantimarinum sp. W242]MDT0556478.1 hypothetical protein [Constantimarinum sp. W242]